MFIFHQAIPIFKYKLSSYEYSIQIESILGIQECDLFSLLMQIQC